MQNTRVITAEEKKKLNKRLKGYGLTICGGSFDSSTGRWSITLNKGTSVNLNYPQIAGDLLLDLEGKEIILDHKLYKKPRNRRAIA